MRIWSSWNPIVFCHVAIVAIFLNLAVACQAQDSAQGAAADITPDMVYGHKDGLAMTMDI